MEQTLIILKPDAMSQKICGKVVSCFEDAGFVIRGCKMIRLSPEVLREHYAHIADKPFYPEVESFMKSTPVIVLALEGKGIIEKMREMLGVTDCTQAAPGSIRERWGSKEPGKSKMCNIAHASDSPEAAQAEIARFFRPEELHRY